MDLSVTLPKGDGSVVLAVFAVSVVFRLRVRPKPERKKNSALPIAPPVAMRGSGTKASRCDSVINAVARHSISVVSVSRRVMSFTLQVGELCDAPSAPEELALPGLWVRPPPAAGERGGSREAARGVFSLSPA